MLLKGMIQGGSVGSKDVTLADVRQDASIEAEKVQLKELNNAGTVKVIEFAATKTENTIKTAKYRCFRGILPSSRFSQGRSTGS